MKEWPRISVVMPCYNEERFIGRAIESLIDEYFRENCELIVIDGGSEDRTREIVMGFVDGEKADEVGIRGKVRMIGNPGRLQSIGMNLGIKEASGEIIVRADAHCIFPAGYVRRCVELLETTGAANAGGAMVPLIEETNGGNGGVDEGNKRDEKENKDKRKEKRRHVQRAIALALQHPVGVGDAKFHLGNRSGYVDTVYLGTFWRKIFDEIGFFDPDAPANEDAELNMRILRAGKKIYLDSSIKVAYFPRETLKQLVKQYFKYGRGRCYTVLKHRRVTSWRQVAPVALVVGLAGAVAVGFVWPWALLLPAAYLVALLVVAVLSKGRAERKEGGLLRYARNDSLPLRILMAVAFAVMHISWGAGFISRLLRK
ncbi:MAG: glycosyltransferase family 2 protein [Clostridiales bacterium]|nr:glycosyltransferase family 2 protein [Clostridiales bacterium]